MSYHSTPHLICLLPLPSLAHPLPSPPLSTAPSSAHTTMNPSSSSTLIVPPLKMIRTMERYALKKEEEIPWTFLPSDELMTEGLTKLSDDSSSTSRVVPRLPPLQTPPLTSRRRSTRLSMRKPSLPSLS